MKLRSVLVCLAVVSVAACKGKGDDFQVMQGDDQPPIDGNGSGMHPEAGVSDARPDADPTSADLSIAMADSPDPVAASTQLTYKLDVTNHGPAEINSTVTVTVHLPSGNVQYKSGTGQDWTCNPSGQVVTCMRPNLLLGAAPTLDIVVTPQSAGMLTASASVKSALTDGDPTNDSASETTTVLVESDLAIVHKNPTTTTSTSGTLSYPLQVTNLGPSDATSVVVTDMLPTGSTFVDASGPNWVCSNTGTTVSCTVATLPTGAAPLLTITATAPTTTGTVSNAASIASAINDPTAANDNDTAMTSVTAPADLSVAISANPDPVAANSTLVYSIDVNNAGPGTAANVTVTNTLPDGNVIYQGFTGQNWSCSQSGQIVTCTRPTLIMGAAPTIKLTITTPSSFTSLTDGVTVASPTDNNATNNAASTTTNGATPHADLSVAIATSSDPVAHGGSPSGCSTGGTGGCEVWTITASNAGPEDATGVSVVITLPTSGSFYDINGTGWVCPAPAGGKITCTRSTGITTATSAPALTLSWTPPNPGGFFISLGAEVSATSTDSNLANNTASASVKVNP